MPDRPAAPRAPSENSPGPSRAARETATIARHAAVYGLANVLNRAVAFLMLPVYTRFLTPADYGTLEILYLLTAVLAILLGIGVGDVVIRFYVEGRSERERFHTVATVFCGLALVSAAPIGAAAAGSPALARAILDDAGKSGLVLLALGGLYFDLLLAVWLSYLRASQRSVALLTVASARLGLNVVLNVWLLVSGWKVAAILTSTLATNIVLVAVLSAIFFLRWGLTPHWRLVPQMLRFGLPLIPSNLASYILVAADRYLLKEFRSFADAGLYALGYKLGSVIHEFVTVPFRQIWAPRRLDNWGPEAEGLYGRIFSYFTALLAWAALAASVLATDVVRLAASDPAYWPAARVVPLVACAHVLMGLYYHFDINVLARRRTEYLMFVNGASAVFNIGANLFLIPRYGAMGAAGATVATYAVRSGLVFFISRALGPLSFSWLRFAHLAASATAVWWVAERMIRGHGIGSVALRLLAVASLPLLLAATGYVRAGDAKRALALWRARRAAPAGSGEG